MATWHCQVKNSRTSMARTGRPTSAAGHYDYISREGKYEKGERAEELIAKNSENMPNGCDPGEFWEAADEYERSNGRTYTEIELALPNELTDKQNEELVREFCEELFGEGHPYSWAIHQKTGALDGRQKNPNVHIMFSERRHDGITRELKDFFKRANSRNPERGGAAKDRDWNDPGAVEVIRETWERLQNRHLEINEHDVRVDRRSLEQQRQDALERGDLAKAAELEREPEKHLGPDRAAKKGNPPLTIDDAKRIATARILKGEGKDISRELKQINKERKLLIKADRENKRAKPPSEQEAARIEVERQALINRESIAKIRQENLQEKLVSDEFKAEIEKQVEKILARDGQDYQMLKEIEEKRVQKLEKKIDALNKRIELGPRSEATLDKMAKSNWQRVYKEEMPSTPEALAKAEQWKNAWRHEDEELVKNSDEISKERNRLEDEINKAKGLPTRTDKEKQEQAAAKTAEKQAKERERANEIRSASKLTGNETIKELKEKQSTISKEITRLQWEIDNLPSRKLNEQQMREAAIRTYQATKFYKTKGAALEQQEKQLSAEIAEFQLARKALLERKPGLLSLPSTKRKWEQEKLKTEEWAADLNQRHQKHRQEVENHKTAIGKDPQVKATLDKIVAKLRIREAEQLERRNTLEMEIKLRQNSRQTIKQVINEKKLVEWELKRLERAQKTEGWGRGYNAKRMESFWAKYNVNTPAKAIKLLQQISAASNDGPGGGMGSLKTRILRDLENERETLEL